MAGTYNNPNAKYGRRGDSMMAHVTPGEQVVPKPVLDANPALAYHIAMAISSAGGNPDQYRVGDGMSINPKTGKPEFGWFSGIRNIVEKVAPIAAGIALAPGTGGASLALGGAIGGAAGSALRGGDVGQVLQGGLYGAGAGGLTSAGITALGSAGAIPTAGTVGPQAGGVAAGIGNVASGAPGAMSAVGGSFYNSLAGVTPGISKVLSALSLGQSFMGSQQHQNALDAQKIGNPDATPPAVSESPTFSPVQPAAMALPTSLASMQSYSPDQVRSALATQGINGGLGSDEQAYYKNLLQRSLIDNGNQVTTNPNFLMPIESSYFSKKGINTTNPNQFLQGIS